MKLRNKKTGEIDDYYLISEKELLVPDSLKEIIDEYEDVPGEVKSWAEEVKIRELPSGLKIADRDYYEIDKSGDKKTEFTWDEAMERFKDNPNWRLPTPKELNQMALELGYTDEGVFDGELFAKNLGYEDEDSGYFWSSYASSTTAARNLYFYGSYLYPQYDTTARAAGSRFAAWLGSSPVGRREGSRSVPLSPRFRNEGRKRGRN